MLDVVELVAHDRRGARRDGHVADAADDLAAGRRRGGGQRLARLGVPEVHGAGHVGPQVGHAERVLLGGGRREQLVVADAFRDPGAAGADEHVLHAEATCLGDAPGVHVLAPHLVPVGGLPLEHGDPQAPLGSRLGERAPRDPASDDDECRRTVHLDALLVGSTCDV